MSRMKELVRPPHQDLASFPEDVARFRRVLHDAGCFASDNDLAWAWRDYSSEEWCAGWMGPEGMNDETILEAIRSRLIER